MDIPYQEINSKTIDRWVEEGWEWGKPVSHEEYEKAKAGTWDVKLTPVKFVPHSWLGELKGKRVLGLASGGGQQMPIFAALGADCTVPVGAYSEINGEKISLTVSDGRGHFAQGEKEIEKRFELVKELTDKL